MVLGYSLTALVKATWKFSFFIQGGLLVPCILLLLVVPERCVDCEGKQPLLESIELRGNGLKYLLNNEVYICSLLTLSCSNFVVSGIAFWGSDYLCNVLQMPYLVLVPVYAFITLSAPTMGMVVGGILCHKLGGYRGRKAPALAFYSGAAGFSVALFAPWVQNYYVFVTLLWVMLFFGGGMVPIMTGVMIDSVKHKKAKALGSSLCVVASNCLGYLPSPVLYGLVDELAGGGSWGMSLVLYWSVFALLFTGMVLKKRC